MPSIKPKIKKKRKISGEPREPEVRDNYKKWPLRSIMFVGLACGAIFFVTSSPTRIQEAKNEQLILQMFLLGLSIVTFFPALLVLFILSIYCVMQALEIRIPKSFLRKFPLLSRFYKEIQRQSNESSFLEIENQRREYIGDTMLELESNSSHDSYSPEDTDSNASEIWTTQNHKRSDPAYQYKANDLDQSTPGTSRIHEYPSVHHKQLHTNPRIVINQPETTSQ